MSEKPSVAEAMLEVNIDITAEAPKVLTTDTVHPSDVVITMGCADTCPAFPGTRHLAWTPEAPAKQGVDSVRPIRGEIKTHVESLVAELVWNRRRE